MFDSSLSYTQSKSDLFPCFCVLSLTFIIIISHPNNSCWPPHQTRNFLMPIFYLISLFLSLFLSLLHANRIFFFLQDYYNFQRILHCHWTEQLYIYVCTMKMNSHCLYLHGGNIQNTYIRLKKKIFICWNVTVN